MDDLVTFLRARYDEREARANAAGARVVVAALLKAGWTPPSEPVTEHAVRMSGGAMEVRNPDSEPIYPLQEWIPAMQTVHRTRVYKRRIIVVDDWTEVPLVNPGPPPPGPGEEHAPGCIPNFYGPGSHTCGPIPKEPDRG